MPDTIEESMLPFQIIRKSPLLQHYGTWFGMKRFNYQIQLTGSQLAVDDDIVICLTFS